MESEQLFTNSGTHQVISMLPSKVHHASYQASALPLHKTGPVGCQSIHGSRSKKGLIPKRFAGSVLTAGRKFGPELYLNVIFPYFHICSPTYHEPSQFSWTAHPTFARITLKIRLSVARRANEPRKTAQIHQDSSKSCTFFGAKSPMCPPCAYNLPTLGWSNPLNGWD